MKNGGACPKCRSNDILRIPGWVGSYATGNNIPTPTKTFQLRGSYVLVTRYVCCDCGYSEEWIDTKDDIEKLRKKFAP